MRSFAFLLAVLCVPLACASDSGSGKPNESEPQGECTPAANTIEEVDGAWRYFEWPPVPDFGVLPLLYSAKAGDRLALVGASNNVARLDPVLGAWEYVGTSNLPSVSPDTWAASGDYLLLQGGNGNVEGSGPRAVIYTTRASVLDFATMTWEHTTPPEEFRLRIYQESFWTGSEFLIYGGAMSEDPEKLSVEPDTTFTSFYDGAFYNPTTKTWRMMPAAREDGQHVYRTNPPGKQRSAIWTDRGLVVVGVDADGQDFYAAHYDGTTGTWQEISQTGPSPRLHVHLAAGEDTVFAAGGFDRMGRQLNEIWAYSFGSDSWSEIEVPSYVRPFRAAWMGNHLIVLGGCPTAAAYFPETGEWKILTDINAPSSVGDASTHVVANHLMLHDVPMNHAENFFGTFVFGTGMSPATPLGGAGGGG